MKEKIFQKLKQEYSHLGLGKEVLQAQADALAASGVVTDENIDAIVSSQSSFLESIQKENDKRATEAQKKAMEQARKEFEASQEAAKRTEEEAKRRAEEEALRKQQEGNMPEWYIREKQEREKNDSLLKQLAEGFEAMKRENESLKLEKATADRNNLIMSKAKALGIPEYRIKEGFSIAADADEAAITDYLTTVSNNIKANSLPSHKTAFPQATGPVKKEDLDNVAKSLVL